MIEAEDFLRRHQPVSPQKPRIADNDIDGAGIEDVDALGATIRSAVPHSAAAVAVGREPGVVIASGRRVERDDEACPSVSASNGATAQSVSSGVAVFGSARSRDGSRVGGNDGDASLSRSAARWGGGRRRRRSSRPSVRGVAHWASHAAGIDAERGESYDAAPSTVEAGDEEACREAALRILDAAAKPSRAMVARLVDKGYARSTAEAVVARLVELRLIDDDAFAEDVLRACHARMMGARGAYRELLRKDVSESMARSKVDRAETLGLFEENAWELGRTVSMKTAGMDRERRLRRFWSAGGRKGHDPEVLRRVAHELFA